MLVALLWIAAGCGATPGPGDAGGDGTGGGDAGPDAPGPALHDTIAYVPASTRDEIRAVDPDGSGDRLLWAHGRPDPHGVLAISDLDWSPDAREIAFTGSHELDCSLLLSDVYAVSTDGGSYRRLSGPPACEGLADFGTATVRVPVRNSTTSSVDIFLHFLGAPEAKQVSLAPGGSAVVTFEDVADLGDGVVQYGMLGQADRRDLAASAAVDVVAGGVHTTAEQEVWTPGSPGWEARSPTWRGDGSRVGYAFNFNTLYGQEPLPEPLSLGDELLDSAEMPNIVSHLNWNPAAAWPDELLYVGWSFDALGVYLVREGSATPGTPVLALEPYETVLGLAWLPDGSGFIVSFREGAAGDRSDLWEVSLEANTATRITGFVGEYAGELSVSPDGREIVFERAAALTAAGADLVDPDLWIVGRDGTELRLLREDAGDPDWSPGPTE